MSTQLSHVQRLLNDINQAHGLRFTVRGRCAGGVIGAWAITDPTGRRAILKCNNSMAHRMTQLPEIIDRIRATGYPTPGWLASGVTADGRAYHVVDFAPGEPMSTSALTGQAGPQLIEVVERHAGLDPDPAQDWSGYARSCAFGEEDNHPRRLVRRMGRSGADLIEHFDAVLAPHKAIDLPTSDLVHGDFNTCNVLAHGGHVSAVIDMDACGSGTRAVDYAWLLREACVEGGEPESIAAIHRAGEEVAGAGVLAICAAATAFDITRFTYRHDRGSLHPVLAGLHRLADVLQRR